jgi:hypothetical protein
MSDLNKYLKTSKNSFKKEKYLNRKKPLQFFRIANINS